jgi:hypothetical protein
VADRVEALSWAEIADRRTELSHDFHDLVHGVAEVEGVFIANAQGERQVSSLVDRAPSGTASATTSDNVASRAYFQAARSGTELVVDGPFISRTSGQPIFSVVRRLSDSNGAFRGIAVLNMLPNRLVEFWQQVVAPGDSISLVREDGTVLARYPNPPAAAGDQPMRFSQIAVDRMRLADVGQFDRTPSPIDGIARTLGYRKLPEYAL